jgi:hypothetical protein
MSEETETSTEATRRMTAPTIQAGPTQTEDWVNTRPTVQTTVAEPDE